MVPVSRKILAPIVMLVLVESEIKIKIRFFEEMKWEIEKTHYITKSEWLRILLLFIKEKKLREVELRLDTKGIKKEVLYLAHYVYEIIQQEQCST